MSELRHDAVGGGAGVEEDPDADAAGVACRDGVAGVCAVRVAVVCAVGGVAGAVRASEVRVAVLAPGAAGAEGGGVTEDEAAVVAYLAHTHGFLTGLLERMVAEQNPQLAGIIAHLKRAQESVGAVWKTLEAMGNAQR